MQHRLNAAVRSYHTLLALAGLAAVLALIALTAAACDTAPTTTATDAASTTTTVAAPSVPPTIRDTGITTTSSPPASVATLASGITSEQMPDDFGFVAAYGVQGRNEFDTFAGTFTKDLGLSEDRVTVRLRLSADALDDLYHDLVMIETQWHVFSDTFAPDPDPENTGTVLQIQPYKTYRLQGSAGGFEGWPLEWEDSSLSQAPEAVALRKWFGKLQAVIELSPEWQELPPMTGGYL